ncbi:Phycobilisome Linker polypeptide [Synechococcus sp. PCC 7502]|uniref:phycobilisome rod-core linker polypeptide n=1 Tax=Synechococcus sp. PCC 7502 TaxID=1173263 RepID=UPI00029FBECE|nr:phycobilisome rod-core linker polypeptide [Synechococcus sp. PCC 7502]AFY75167.1 Phycobilisome Linker polypeptide [Synechococcus sp. PCC 7502]
MLPLTSFKPTTQNHRVNGYDVPDEDDPVIYRLSDVTDSEGLNALIWAAYRQIFSEHLIIESNRQTFLESQLKNRQISVRDFIRGLGKSEPYYRLIAETNSNYRLVDLSFTRFLGRASYGKDEQIANSIIIGTKGLEGFIDSIIDSDEYLDNFGEDIVPYQRRRNGDRPYNLVNPRYSDYQRAKEAALVTSGSLNVNKKFKYGVVSRERIRSGIPSVFFSLVSEIAPAQANYQYARSGGINTNIIDIPDTTVESKAATVSRRESLSPYRYLPK